MNILTRNRKKVAAIIPIEALEAFEQCEDQQDRQAAEIADEDVKKHGTISWEEAKKELQL